MESWGTFTDKYQFDYQIAEIIKTDQNFRGYFGYTNNFDTKLWCFLWSVSEQMIE